MKTYRVIGQSFKGNTDMTIFQSLVRIASAQMVAGVIFAALRANGLV